MVLAEAPDYLIVLAICVGMTTISQLFRHFFGMNPQQSMEMQQRMKDMQREMMNNRDDPETLRQLQAEAMQSYRTMMRKQLLPNCIYSILFIVLWIAIRGLFDEIAYFGAGSEGSFFFIYLIFSLSLSAIIAGIRYLIKRSKRKKGLLPDENYDASLDRGIQSGLKFGRGWDTALSPELKQMRSNLAEKQSRGEIPRDIDIDAEINQISKEEKDDKKDWKKRLDS